MQVVNLFWYFLYEYHLLSFQNYLHVSNSDTLQAIENCQFVHIIPFHDTANLISICVDLYPIGSVNHLF